MLQADSKEMFDAWIQAMHRGIGAAIQRVNNDTGEFDKRSLYGGQTYSANNEDNRSNSSDDSNKKVKKVR